MTGGKPRGRKPFPKGEALSRMLSCRVRPDEELAIRAAAKAAGKPLALWIRDVLLRAAKPAKGGGAKATGGGGRPATGAGGGG